MGLGLVQSSVQDGLGGGGGIGALFFQGLGDDGQDASGLCPGVADGEEGDLSCDDRGSEIASAKLLSAGICRSSAQSSRRYGRSRKISWRRWPVHGALDSARLLLPR